MPNQPKKDRRRLKRMVKRIPARFQSRGLIGQGQPGLERIIEAGNPVSKEVKNIEGAEGLPDSFGGGIILSQKALLVKQSQSGLNSGFRMV